MTNWSIHIECGPPCITTNSGYFFEGSKFGGSATKLWIRASRAGERTSQRLPVDPRGALGVEARERRPAAGRRVDPSDLRRVHRAFPPGGDHGRRPAARDVERSERARCQRADFARLPAARGHGEQFLTSLVLCEEEHRLAVG
jgi:hypothetical protein